MEPQRPKFCSAYQTARVCKGRPSCLYTRFGCPHGRHACQSCGREGHGSEDCRWKRPMPEVVAPTKRPPLAVPAETGQSSAESRPLPKSAALAGNAVFVQGFGYKGEGKMANYGVTVPMPSLVPRGDVANAPPQGSTSSCSQLGAARPSDPLIPSPIQATAEEVEEWMSNSYKPLQNISKKNPPEVGESVLWRNMKRGRSGNPST